LNYYYFFLEQADVIKLNQAYQTVQNIQANQVYYWSDNNFNYIKGFVRGAPPSGLPPNVTAQPTQTANSNQPSQTKNQNQEG
jgi:hypothetical protein